jgi:hypothetical protein
LTLAAPASALKKLPSMPTRLPPMRSSFAALLHEVAVQRLERLGVVAAEVGDAVVARAQTAEQPDQLDVAPAFRLQPSAGADAVEVAVQIQLEHVARVERRLPAPRSRRRRA